LGELHNQATLVLSLDRGSDASSARTLLHWHSERKTMAVQRRVHDVVACTMAFCIIVEQSKREEQNREEKRPCVGCAVGDFV